MAFTRRRLSRSADDIGWISTTDMFVVACCFFIILSVSQSEKIASLAEQLEVSSEQLRDRAALGADVAPDVEKLIERSESLLAELNETKEELVSLKRERDEYVQGSEQKISGLTRQLALQSESTRIKVAEISGLRNDLDAAREQIAQLESSGLRSSQISSSRISGLSRDLAARQSEVDLLRQEVRSLQRKLAGTIEESSRMREQALAQQRKINNTLVGLGGKLEKVVFMVDTSKSMQNAKGVGGVVLNNWVPVVEVIERWVNGLDVKAASLIVFGDEAEVVVPMQGLDNGGRKRILDALRNINPTAESTNFLAAFEKAFRIPAVDTIIVFSDGLPSVDVKGAQISPASRRRGESELLFERRFIETSAANVERVLGVHRKISSMAKLHPGVAINAIGLGAGVYNEKTGNLLNELALDNGGVFLALPSRILVE